MKYKRFTEKVDSGFVSELDCRIAYNKLCAIEDKIESGTLIELPCKVGDTIYVIPHLWDRKGIFVGEIDKRKADAFYVIGDFVDIEDDILGEFYRVGVEVFLTREAAEKRLKELQNGDND